MNLNHALNQRKIKPTEVEGPSTHLGLDIIGPLSKTRNNNQYIIVVVDYFTKWVEAEPKI